MDIGGRIREERKNLGLSQGALARKTGQNRSYLSLVENGRRSPTFNSLDRIAQGLGLDILTLILGEKLESYKDEAGKEVWVSPGLKKFLTDENIIILMNPTKEEIIFLRGIRVTSTALFFWPSAEFYQQALIDYRKQQRLLIKERSSPLR